MLSKTKTNFLLSFCCLCARAPLWAVSSPWRLRRWPEVRTGVYRCMLQANRPSCFWGCWGWTLHRVQLYIDGSGDWTSGSPALTAGALPMEPVLLLRFSALLPVASLWLWLLVISSSFPVSAKVSDTQSVKGTQRLPESLIGNSRPRSLLCWTQLKGLGQVICS